jgi:hypothetical protein
VNDPRTQGTGHRCELPVCQTFQDAVPLTFRGKGLRLESLEGELVPAGKFEIELLLHQAKVIIVNSFCVPILLILLTLQVAEVESLGGGQSSEAGGELRKQVVNLGKQVKILGL